MSVRDRESSHKWLGCMLTTAPVQTTTCDVECRLQAAARAFNANRWILSDPKVSIAQKLEYFDRVTHSVFLQLDTEPFTAMIYAVWMLHIVGFSDQWWGPLAIWTGHYHGMKSSTSGMSAFGPSPRRLDPNHGRKFAYDTTGIWHSIRNTTWASLDQEGFSLAATGAQTQ